MVSSEDRLGSRRSRKNRDIVQNLLFSTVGLQLVDTEEG